MKSQYPESSSDLTERLASSPTAQPVILLFEVLPLKFSITFSYACIAFLGATTLASTVRGIEPPSEPIPPNIILMMSDDQGWGDTGYQGNTLVQTPNLDQMAQEGITFNRWYAAAPVCSPTRGSCLTGRHPYRFGIYSANVGSLKAQEIGLAVVLRAQGYKTGHFGKWHLGTLTTQIKDSNRGGPGSEAIYSPPWHRGFDTCFSTEAKVPTFEPMKNPSPVSRASKKSVPQGDFYGTYYWTEDGQTVPFEVLRGDDSRLIVDRALQFIEAAASDEKPFFAVLWFHTPHLPVVADDAHRSLYPDHPLGLYGQHYHGSLSALDDEIGRLRTRLDQLGIAEETMLWYSSDNGPEHSAEKGAGQTAGLRGRKRSLYEGGIRVPGLLVWPGKIPGGRTINAPCVTSDYFPTILDLLDLELPDRPYDGISLLPFIDDATTRRGMPIGFQSSNQLAWIEDRYKLYSGDQGKSWELYDLRNDPSESEDLAASMPDRVRAMSSELLKWVDSCRKSNKGADY